MSKHVLAALCAVLWAEAHAQDRARQDLVKGIPAEYEATTALGAAMNNAGYAANDPHAAVRANPALLPLEKQYSVSAGYHWPIAGREFYQASVVDSKTAGLAAGVSYTGYTDDYRYETEGGVDPVMPDSPVVRRGVIGVGQVFGTISLGAGATYVEAHPLLSSEERERGQDRVRGVGMNLGLAGNANGIRYGVSAENLSNRKIQDYAPRTYRAGVAYPFSPTLIAYLDFRQRDRVLEFEGTPPSLDDARSEPELGDPEQLVIASFTAQAQDFLRIMGSYGHAVSSDRRRAAAAGVAVVNQGVGLAYTVSRPYLAIGETHQTVSLTLDVAL